MEEATNMWIKQVQNKLLKKATLKCPAADFDDAIYEEYRMLNTYTIELLQQCKWLDDTKTY